MFLLVALIGYLFLATVAVLDKFVISGQKMKPVVFTFYSTIFVLPLIFLLPFGAGSLGSGLNWILAIIAGFTFALGLWTLYVGTEVSQISHFGPLVGALVALFIFVFSSIFLHERLTLWQMGAMIALTIGALVISVKKGAKRDSWRQEMLWGILAGLFFAISHVSSKYIYGVSGFYSGFIWTRLFSALLGLLLLFSPAVRKDIFAKKAAPQGHQPASSSISPVKKFIAVIANKVLGALGVVLVQYAIALGSVTLVNALASIQYAFLIIMMFLSSKFSPKFIRERYARGELLQEGVAVLIIGAGLTMLLI